MSSLVTRGQIKFSVLICVYYRDVPRLFECALGSIFTNTIVPNQVVLVVDGEVGSDIKQIIDHFVREHSLTTVYLPRNLGLANALNEGLKHISTEWVFRADSDDINLVDRFERQLQQLDGSIDILGGAIIESDPDGTEIAIRCPPLDHSSIYKFMRYRNPFNHMTVAYRKDFVQKVGGYPNIHLKEDYALWAKMLSNGARSKNIPDILVRATTGKQMYARRGGLNYIKSEFMMQKLLISCGLQSSLNAFVVGILRSTVFIMPSNLRAFVYEKFLRVRITN